MVWAVFTAYAICMVLMIVCWGHCALGMYRCLVEKRSWDAAGFFVALLCVSVVMGFTTSFVVVYFSNPGVIRHEAGTAGEVGP